METFGPDVEAMVEKRGEKFFPDLKAVNAYALRRRGVVHIDISTEKRGEKFFPDLKAVNAYALRRRGVVHIDISTACTYCQCQRFWSHRASHGDRGSQGAVIVCKEGRG